MIINKTKKNAHLERQARNEKTKKNFELVQKIKEMERLILK